MSGKIPRLKQVAEAAEVSLSAASRILRGQTDRFSEATITRVNEAAQTLGWRPNLLVSGMQTGHSKMVGVLVPPFDSFWVDVLSGIHTTLAKHDYLPITVWVGNADDLSALKDGDDDAGLAQLSRLLDRRVEGLILWPQMAEAYNDHFETLIEQHIPVAMIDYDHTLKTNVFSVQTDEDSAGREIAQHLFELGHRRIACVSTEEGQFHHCAILRRRRFEEALQSLGEFEYTSLRASEISSVGVDQIAGMLSEFQPTAVFAVTDHQAAAVYRAAHRTELRIPQQLSVVGFADLDFAEKLSPPLTTVRQDAKKIGRLAAEYIVNRLKTGGDQVGSSTVKVETTLVERASTAPKIKNVR
jgi:LacI family transcriptional regulator